MNRDDDEEQLESQWRGAFIRVELFTLLSKGEITPKEVILLGLIDSFVGPFGKRGCYASDKTLGERLGVSERTITNMVCTLTKRGFIYKGKYYKRHRTLFVYWSKGDEVAPKSVKATSRNSEGPTSPNSRGPYNASHYTKHKHEHTRFRGKIRGELKSAFITNTTQEITTSPLDLKLAETLYSILIRHGRILSTIKNKGRFIKCPKPKMENWAKIFGSLVKTVGDRKRVKAVLKWFKLNAAKKYTPVVYSAKMFKEKFLQIESAMKRDQKDAPQEVKLSKQESAIVKFYQKKQWPKNFEEHLPLVVRKSIDNWESIKKCLQKKAIGRFVQSHCAPAGEAMIYSWLDMIYERVCNWEDWHGKPEYAILSVENKLFKQMLFTWAGRYGTGTTAVMALWKGLKDAD